MIVLPRNTADPAGQDKRERAAIARFDKAFAGILKDALALLAKQKYRKITLSNPFATNAADDVVKYQFEVDEVSMELTAADIDEIVDRWLEMRGDANDQWLATEYAIPAYQQGTGIAVANLSMQSKVYKDARQSLSALMMTPEYRRRVGFVKGRVFESMKGLSASSKERLRTALVDGMTQGMNPLAIAESIKEAVGGSLNRARTIARTEITTAMRRSRIEEGEQAAIDFDFRVMMMQLSALSSTTRISHARRHGKLFTFEQARVWMATSPNMINCKCTFVEVIVGADGKPLAKGVQDRAQEMYDKSPFAGQ